MKSTAAGNDIIDMAVYNLGESYYRGRKWEPAAKQFGLFLDRFPKSKQTPSARLLYALSLIRLGKNKEEALQYLESIPQDFPKSPEAGAARRPTSRPAVAPSANPLRKPTAVSVLDMVSLLPSQL